MLYPAFVQGVASPAILEAVVYSVQVMEGMQYGGRFGYGSGWGSGLMRLDEARLSGGEVSPDLTLKCSIIIQFLFGEAVVHFVYRTSKYLLWYPCLRYFQGRGANHRRKVQFASILRSNKCQMLVVGVTADATTK